MRVEEVGQLETETPARLGGELGGEFWRVGAQGAKGGKTGVADTHKGGVARRVASQVIFLHQGKIEEEGTPDEVFGNPKSTRLQQFLKGSLK